jgi:hypothetical protein
LSGTAVASETIPRINLLARLSGLLLSGVGIFIGLCLRRRVMKRGILSLHQTQTHDDARQRPNITAPSFAPETGNNVLSNQHPHRPHIITTLYDMIIINFSLFLKVFQPTCGGKS